MQNNKVSETDSKPEWRLQHNLFNTLLDVASGHYSPRFACEVILADFGHKCLEQFGQDGRKG